MARRKMDVDRITNHGGVLIVFSAPRHVTKYAIMKTQGNSQVVDHEVESDNWNFFSVFESGSEKYLRIDSDQGEDIRLTDFGKNFLGPSARLVSEGNFNAIFSHGRKISDDSWFSLAENKYGACVAFAIRGPNTMPF